MEEAKRVVDEHEAQKARIIAKKRRVADDGPEAQARPGAADNGEQPAAAAESGGIAASQGVATAATA
eukprot:8290210-Pyramimonas_sp.AAC.1